MTCAHKILGSEPVEVYLDQCQVRNTLVENQHVHVPPTPGETKALMAYLDDRNLEAAIVGSVGVLHYVKDTGKFRPTVDLDVFVHTTTLQLRRLEPPAGWKVDLESPGVASWISPTGGYVDFMTAGHIFPGGSRTPDRVTVDKSSGKYPVAVAADLFKLKLNSMREKDLSDMITLARALGGVPDDLGPLNQTQKENLDLARQWFKLRPTGGYRE